MTRRVCLVVLLGFFLVSAQGVSQEIALKEAFPRLTFRHILFLTHSGDHTNRLFAVRQDGIIHVFANSSSATSAPVFLDISRKLSSAQYEEGLLGLAFPPDFPTRQVFYIYYTAPSTKSPGAIKAVIARYAVSSSDPNIADIASGRIVLEIEKQYPGHNAGMLAFGPDSMLYIGVGDGDSADNAQSRSTLLGKILRIDVRSDSGYTIPPDNPFAGNKVSMKEEIWAYGFRNPWRFSIDSASGELWAGDVGQDTREEIDLVTRGANYGWSVMEGSFCHLDSNCDMTGLTMPVVDYGRALGYCVTGGYIYRGSRLPQLRGAYIYADYGSGYVFLLRREGGVVTADSVLLHTGVKISSFGIDEQNEIYILAHSTGDILKLVASPASTSVETTEAPLQYELGQNYPNPFNPLTVIKYNVGGTGVEGRGSGVRLKLAVYDLLGREVATLVDEQKAPGRYEVSFNGRRLASGIYLYRLTAGSFVQARTMVLMK